MKHITFDEETWKITITVPGDAEYKISVIHKIYPFSHYTFSDERRKAGNMYLPFHVAGMDKEQSWKLINKGNVRVTKMHTKSNPAIGYLSMQEIKKLLETLDMELTERDHRDDVTGNQHYNHFSVGADFTLIDPRTGERLKCLTSYHSGLRATVRVDYGDTSYNLFFVMVKMLGYQSAIALAGAFAEMDGGRELLTEGTLDIEGLHVPRESVYDYIKILDMMLTEKFGKGQKKQNKEENRERMTDRRYRLAGHVQLEFD